MNKYQERVIALLDSAEPKENLDPWIHGNIPKHYKRLSIGMDEAKELAVIGAAKSIAYFDTKMYFTQALLVGAVMSGRYKKIKAVTTSQYGKSWMCGELGLLLANNEELVYIAGADSDTSDIIMGKVMGHIQTANYEIKNKLLEPADKLERLQTAVSKRKIALKGGGAVEAISLGDTFNDPKKRNKAIGRGGHFIIDEASLISDEAYAEMGRSEFASDTEDDEFIRFEISNPHNPGRFFDSITAEEVPKDTLIVWMDARTAYEEGRIKSKEKVIESEFFAHKSTCIRYLLCELEDYSEDSMFGVPIIDDSELTEDLTFFMGVDSAYKGKDGIVVFLCALNTTGKVRMFEKFKLNKDVWIDGVTSQEIIDEIVQIARIYNVKMICVDVGKGIWLVEGLSQQADSFIVKGVDFGSGTTKFRKEAKHYSAVYGFNMRAELHMDLEDLMDNQRVTFTSEMYDSLKEQMNAVKSIKKGEGAKTMIIPKDDIKKVIGKSPDELDAAILALHALLLYSMMQGTFLYQEE